MVVVEMSSAEVRAESAALLRNFFVTQRQKQRFELSPGDESVRKEEEEEEEEEGEQGEEEGEEA